MSWKDVRLHSKSAEGIMFQCSAKVIKRCDKMGSGDLPITHSASLGRKTATYLENLSAVGRILSSIAFLVYLGQSLVRSAIKLELKDVTKKTNEIIFQKGSSSSGFMTDDFLRGLVTKSPIKILFQYLALSLL